MSRPRNMNAVADCCAGCEFRERCAVDELACASFYSYVNSHPFPRTRTPSRYWFAAIFTKTDDEDENAKLLHIAHYRQRHEIANQILGRLGS